MRTLVQASTAFLGSKPDERHNLNRLSPQS